MDRRAAPAGARRYSVPDSSRTMRLALALLLAAAAGTPADAQARFVDACVASSQSEDVPFDPASVCGCAATQALVAGATPADLDRLMDHVRDDDLEVDQLPGPLQPTGMLVTNALVECALADIGVAGGAEMQSAYAESFDPDVPAVAVVPAAAGAEAGAATPAGAVAPPAAARPTLPTGLRTGNGDAAVRTLTPSPGGAIRIVG